MEDRRHDPADDRISVEIKIAGSVINSTITGVDKRSIQTRSPMFGRVLSEYLILPTMRELARRAQRRSNTFGRSLRTFDFSRHGLEYLWMSLLQDQYWMAGPANFTVYGSKGLWAAQHGNHVAGQGASPDPILHDQWLVLRKAQLSPFVNRSPGRFYRGGWEFSRGHSRSDDEYFLVSTEMWTWEDYAVRTMGIGDVRLPQLDGYYLLQATTATGKDHTAGVMGAGVMGGVSPDGRHYAGGAAISALGFPILVSESLYHRFARLIASYGAAAVERLTVRLVRAPERTGLLWAPGVPKTVLIASDEKAAAGIAEPTPAYNAVWTVAADDSFRHIHYCTWGFRTGVRTFRSELEAATRVISSAIEERGLRACFEFDYEQNWFGESTLFAVTDMVNLSARLPTSNHLREAAEQVAYAAQFDTLVERESGLNAEQRSVICMAIGDLQSGRLEDARRVVESIDEDARRTPFVQDLEARIAWLSGRTQAAVQLWHAALDNHPSYELRDRIARSLQIVNAHQTEAQ